MMLSKFVRRAARNDFKLIRDECGDLEFSVRMLAGRLTPLYLIVLCVILLCVMHFHGKVPGTVLYGPGALLGLAIIARLKKWLGLTRAGLDTRLALNAVNGLHRSGPAIGALFTSWMMLLYGYGDVSDQGLIHLLTAATGIISVLCLGATPFAAVLVAFSVLVPSSVIYLSANHPTGDVVACVQAAIFAAVIRIVFLYQSDLVMLSRSRRAISLRERAARAHADLETKLASTDVLTGLRNRRSFLEALSRKIAKFPDEHIGLAILDLDGFKDINDSLGHVAGDKLLQVLSQRLSDTYPGQIIGRLGGDEFAILYASNLTGGLPERSTLEGVIELLRLPVEFEGLTFGVGASLGYVEDFGRVLTVKDFLERADHAMYTAKDKPGVSVVIYGQDHDRQLKNRQQLISVISQPGFEKFLSLQYQPIVDVRSNGIVGVEALTRWSSPGLAEVPTLEFIRLAETSGQMNLITQCIAEKAVRECPVWDQGGSLFINISGHDLMRPGSLASLADIVTSAGAPPENITFEITETAIVNIDCAVEILSNFRERGFRFALDDFGAGLSSLSRVHRLPINVLKIDGGFVENITDDPRCRAAIGTVLELARQMKIDCIIEGIETAQQALHASRLGGRLMQGYLFGRPDSAERAMNLFESAPMATPTLPFVQQSA